MTILLGARTDYRCKDYKAMAKADVEAAAEMEYDELKTAICMITRRCISALR